MVYFFTNLLGTFLLDEHLRIVEELLFKSVQDYLKKETAEKKLWKTNPSMKPLPLEKLPQVLALFRDQKYFTSFYQKNLELTRQALRDSVSEDQLIIQAIANISEIDKVINLLCKRLREWYGWYLPELSEATINNEQFLSLVMEKKKEELLKDLSLKETMGAELDTIHVEEMLSLAQETLHFYSLRKKHEGYLQKVMQKYCPNLLELAGVTIGAKLIELGRSLKHLALLPSSTIQLLGAEKALFRHIKTGSRPPKYGVILGHQLVQKAARDEKGKAARMLADKLSLCCRLDYFKGEFKAKEYRKELEEKIK